jgi:hypothetical protein
VVVEVAVNYYEGNEAVKILELVPGDSWIVPKRIPLESTTFDEEISHADERALVIAVTHQRSHNDLTIVKVYCLTRQGVVYVRRSTQVNVLSKDNR